MSEVNAVAVPREIALILRFSDLPIAVKDWLCSQSKTLGFKTGETIIRESDEAKFLFAIISGSVKKLSLTADGTEVILLVLGSGECFCEMTFLGQKKYGYNVVAMEDTKLLCINRETYLALLEEFPESVLPSLRDLSFRITALQNRIVGLSAGDVEHRLAHLILSSNLMGAESDTICISDLSRQDLASLIGARPETLSRVLSDWCDQGIAQRLLKKISFQKDELEAIVSDTDKKPIH